MLYERLLKALREEKRTWEHLLMEERSCVQDFAAYRFYVGKIMGLTQAIKICIETFGKDADEHEPL